MTGGAVLNGRVRVTGAKNSALKLMAAALLAAGTTTIDEVPDILDVAIMSEVLRRLGCEVTYERTGDGGGGGRVVVDVPEKPSTETDYDLVRKMRASINVLGPLVARCGSARRWRSPGATRSAPAGSTCTSPAWSGSARRSSASTASWSPPRPGSPAPRSGWTSRPSARPRTW